MDVKTRKFNRRDHESAELKLSLLKENFDFRDSFDLLEKDPYSICPELRRPDESLGKYCGRLGNLLHNHIPFFGNFGEAFGFLGINEHFMLKTQAAGIPLAEVLDLLNPNKDLSAIISVKLKNMLPGLFIPKGIQEIPMAEKIVTWAWQSRETQEWTKLRPYERLLKIDLRRRKTELLQEFSAFLEAEKQFKESLGSVESKDATKVYFSGGYSRWDFNTSRQRKETREQLAVWNLRKQNISYKEIAKQLNMIEDPTRKRFYAAWRKTQGYPYDKEDFKKIIHSARKEVVPNPCENCDNYNCLNAQEMSSPDWEPCSRWWGYINQDCKKSLGIVIPASYLRRARLSNEIIGDKNHETLLDYLHQKNLPRN